ncbi:MAG TPA: RHS repeat-associated core domain-containing protein, partial [Candidatus Hydrogenedentes bacterium]|nr:RHS repeat-associated core domain-containing protein [Candidatus Hydrogenedentota bacterium]
YDNWGRLATRAQGSYSASYAYRYGGRLYQATSNFPNESTVTFDYGGDGKLRTRTTASETRRYRYDRGWNAVNEEVGGTTLASSVFEPGAQVGSILAQMLGTLASGAPVYAYHDHLATVRQWRYPNKNLARANEYDPYGNFYSYSGYMPMPRIYALHEFDLALQQYRAPYRNYSPSMARWTTLDPAGMVDGPNMYVYVGGKQIDSYDPLGLEECCKQPREDAYHQCKVAYLTATQCVITSTLCALCIGTCVLLPVGRMVCLWKCSGLCATAGVACGLAVTHGQRCAVLLRRYTDCLVGARSNPCCTESS